MDSAPADFRVVDVVSVTMELPEQFPVITLEEAEGARRELTFRVGMAEGAAIAHALRRLRGTRPLTHELMTSVLGRLGADVAAVRLVGRQGAVYLAELDLMSTRGRQVLECRPSDAITLALRQGVRAPILVDDRLLSTTGDVVPGPG